MKDEFGHFARRIAEAAGSPYAFATALSLILVWFATGPLFDYSSRWQLVVNTGTTIVTFLMVFLIQNAANRDQVALQLKMDELLKAVSGARTGLIDLENLTVEQVDALKAQFSELAEKHADDITKMPGKRKRAARKVSRSH